MTASDKLENVNPRTYEVSAKRELTDADFDDSVTDPFDTREIFDLIRDINDPEHPLTLEQLNVVTEDQVHSVYSYVIQGCMYVQGLHL